MAPDSGLPPLPEGASFALPTDIVDSVIQTESAGNPAAVGPPNPSGELALGLMQVLPSTGREMAAKLGLPSDNIEHRLLDPSYNRKIGEAYLNEQFQKYGGD